jgi:hypothetical protein
MNQLTTNPPAPSTAKASFTSFKLARGSATYTFMVYNRGSVRWAEAYVSERLTYGTNTGTPQHLSISKARNLWKELLALGWEPLK